jgi:uroporphyrinogen decarboxylase
LTRKERFFATIERRSVDRPASWLGIPATAALPRLLSHFQAEDQAGLKQTVGDDVRPVELPYHSPVADAIHLIRALAAAHGAGGRGNVL